MPRQRSTAVRRRRAPTTEEWNWLCAWSEADPAIGFFPAEIGRLQRLWEAHEARIRAMWKKRSPEVWPPAHPAHPAQPGPGIYETVSATQEE